MGIKSLLRRLKRHFVIRVKEVSLPYEIKLIKEDRFRGQSVVVHQESGLRLTEPSISFLSRCM